MARTFAPAFALFAALAVAAGIAWGRVAWAWASALVPGLEGALLGTLFTSAATGLGAAPVLICRRIGATTQAVLLGAGAGVMLAASAFSLMMPALAEGEVVAGSQLGGASLVVLGVALGAFALLAIDRLLPHEHFVKGIEGGGDAARFKRIWLLVIALALHNLPEGLATGVGFAGGDATSGETIAIGIALQNIPEGLVVAASLWALGYSRLAAAGISFATGLVEVLGGLLGVAIAALATVALPVGLAFAAGAMLFVVSHEVVPESHRGGHETAGTLGVVGGFLIMTLLALGFS